MLSPWRRRCWHACVLRCWFGSWRAISLRWRSQSRQRRFPASQRGPRARWRAAALAAFAVALVLAWLLPVIAYDALAYRLPVIAQWLDAGRVAWVSSDDAVRNGYPLGQEAVSALLVAATASMRIASVTSFAFVAAGAMSLWSLCEACGVRRSLARAAAALFVLAPMTLLNAPSGYVDAAFAAATIALFCSSALWLASARADMWLAAATGMAAAHVLALKGTGIAFVGCAGLCLAGAAALQWFVTRRTQPIAWGRLLRSVGVAVVCALPGAFWVARNVAHTGNPLWPVEVKLAGHVVFAGVASMDQVLSAASNTPPQLVPLGEGARIARVWLQMSGPALDFDDRLAGLGFVWPLFALPALIACMWAIARARGQTSYARALLLVLAMTAGCFVLQPLRWWPRYSLWLWGGGALALAVQAEALARAGRRQALSCALALLAMVCMSEAALAVTHAKDAGRAAGRWSRSPRSSSRTSATPPTRTPGSSRPSGAAHSPRRRTYAAARGSRPPTTPISTGFSRSCSHVRACTSSRTTRHVGRTCAPLGKPAAAQSFCC